MRLLSVLVVAWLIIGFFAGLQRELPQRISALRQGGIIAATLAAGPLSYVGANPKVHCTIPAPSG
jgi:hypothetical protein